MFSDNPGVSPHSSGKPLFNVLPSDATPAPLFDYRLPRNVTVAVGQSAFLKCKVCARENRTVSSNKQKQASRSKWQMYFSYMQI